MANLSGINVAMQTPFNEDGSINFSAYAEVIEQYIAAGVHGLVLGAGTGQHPFLTEEECNKLYEVGIKQINKRCNVICQSSALNVDEVVRRSQHAEKHGADALMILPPYFEGPTDDDSLFNFYKEIDAAVNIDIIGYNIPQATQIAVSTDLLQRLAELKNFTYIKDSAGDLTTQQGFLTSDACKTKVAVLNGCDTTTFYALVAGAKGAIWGGANAVPHEAVRMYNLVQEKKYAEALQVWEKILPLMLLFWNGRYVPLVLKAAQLNGFGTGNLRKPLRALEPAEEAELKKVLEQIKGA
ncbi:dihydrodipicolinate synthase family protein [Pseudomonas sp. CC120222-01a]|uniref:dihydrodipicolinate synthase family protein n=1 Tax=Pseudomonas sp. CC120222-01a TaxID=1378075 RepID=UPI000D9EA07C|nr:dihydrodipicolinate synthase family protein [Pseudomonas sp. CC120222-01a]PVZ41208.1 4-hydroxy-tetrahydrodipicolinate synthase [Pseudomonas sp. CC120222-01a]